MKTLNQQIGKILDKELQLDMSRPVRAKMEVVRQIVALIQSEYMEKDITSHDFTDLDQARDDYYNRPKLFEH